MTMSNCLVDYGDVQGLVRYGHGRLPEACFLLVRVNNLPAARSWLAGVPITAADTGGVRPERALQIAVTREGLEALAVPRAIIRQFSPEFIAGMAGEESRSRRLGDVGANAPEKWLWGGAGNVPHLLLMLYAGQDKVQTWADTMVAELTRAGLALMYRLCTAPADGQEPFGFRDNISQPEVDWNLARPAPDKDNLLYTNSVSLGEFLLGYSNEYGQYTERPLLEAAGGNDSLLAALDQLDKRDLGRNGTYLVFRHLRQDVRGFWRFLDDQVKGNAAARRGLAESMVGRTMDGVPLVGADRAAGGNEPRRPREAFNDFTFEHDPDGLHCPFGAHIRRANPRSADLPDGAPGPISRLLRTLGFCRRSIRTDSVASARFHRLLRRGRKFGSQLSAERALIDEDREERGLYFLCVNANISRQFEFVQQAWIMGTKFNGLSDEADPLLGNRLPAAGRPADTFSIPQSDTLRRRINGMPQFVTVQGGAYFFMPSIRALRYLAACKRDEPTQGSVIAR
jgi:Dyp-type peroxidase family